MTDHASPRHAKSHLGTKLCCLPSFIPQFWRLRSGFSLKEPNTLLFNQNHQRRKSWRKWHKLLFCIILFPIWWIWFDLVIQKRKRASKLGYKLVRQHNLVTSRDLARRGRLSYGHLFYVWLLVNDIKTCIYAIFTQLRNIYIITKSLRTHQLKNSY